MHQHVVIVVCVCVWCLLPQRLFLVMVFTKTSTNHKQTHKCSQDILTHTVPPLGVEIAARIISSHTLMH
jgi:hypothetical protein